MVMIRWCWFCMECVASLVTLADALWGDQLGDEVFMAKDVYAQEGLCFPET